MSTQNRPLENIRKQTPEETWAMRMAALSEDITEEKMLEQARRNGSLRDKPPKRKALRK